MSTDNEFEWAETPAITVENVGYFGNKLIRFMAAYAAASFIGDCTISNFDFSEWGIHYPRVDNRRYRRTILIDHIEQFDFKNLRSQVRRDPSLHIIVRHFLQRQELFLPPKTYNEIFPIISKDVPVFSDKYLVINIRAGDILSGFVEWYPLIPIGFYVELVRTTGLTPVFTGQLDDCLYVDNLRKAFPNATFIESQGAVRDFDTIRLSANIVPSVSTFSVVAAWLSNAKTVYLPLNGFLNPCHKHEIDLIPTDDARYRFFLFPLNYALPEEEALIHHSRIEGMWKEISVSRVKQLKRASPLIASGESMPEEYNVPGFDERWYIHQYPNAALDISDGWYKNGMHHYIDIGRTLGYRYSKITFDTSCPNVAIGCRAWQSSISQWSKGKTIYDDAMRAVNGNRNVDYAFHTELECDPWWVVDLGGEYDIKEIMIFNRKGIRALQERNSPLLIEVAPAEQVSWSTLFKMDEGSFFGADDSGLSPLHILVQDVRRSRFLRVKLITDRNCLSLAQIEIYAIPFP
jgi:hypothetical protein